MKNNYPKIPWCRYADDALAHSNTERQAQQLLEALRQRYGECGLELHPDKTKIIYCKDGRRKGKYTHTKFDFLGYSFRRRTAQNSRDNSLFLSFIPAVSSTAMKSMRAETRRRGFRNQTDLSLNDIAKIFNPTLLGWINYYGRYTRSELNRVLRYFNKTLVAWAMKSINNLEVIKREQVFF